ncbi:cupin domain-containing protein [bacterium LRH843]|nr:cupin domain-containing protein [bacterium LRH843]
MYYYPYMYRYSYPYYDHVSIYPYGSQPMYWPVPAEFAHAGPFGDMQLASDNRIVGRDYGKEPFVVNIEEATERNRTFRTAIWTGNHLQVTLMSIDVGGDIGLEVHPTVDQFLRIEEGQGIVRMGNSRDHLTFEKRVSDDDAIMVPAGTWHNLINTGNRPIKLYTIYAPPEHPFGTVHETQADAIAAEESHFE